ncbi:hypothetical protein [Actinomadura miaoliensis]|uniref:ATP-binding protein n=1 Tax=Actinomadura miaoliensis TaxID=430685 RepID=A0ABP7WB00_9ACTN
MDTPREYRTHRPSGRPAPPLILLEGPEKVGKSYTAAQFTGSDKVGDAYWIEFGEVTAEEYGQVPGADYEIIEHDGSFADFYGAIQWVYGKAQAAREAGEKPVLLTIDSMSAEWDLIRAWTNNRAKASRVNRERLEQDPNAEIFIPPNLWNDANDRDYQVMRLLMTFPGIVVMLARGKQTAAFDEATGRPLEGRTDYRVEANKQIGYRASCWVRLSRDEPPLLVGCRKVTGGVKPGVDRPMRLKKNWSLEWLVFEHLGYDPANWEVPNLVSPRPERTPEQIAEDARDPATGFERLGELLQETKACRYESVIVPNERGQDELLPQMIRRLGWERMAASQELHKRMQALWKQTPMAEDRDARLAFTREVIGRDIASSSELTRREAEQVIDRLKSYIAQDSAAGNGGRTRGRADGAKDTDMAAAGKAEA